MSKGLIVSGGYVDHDLLLKLLKKPYDQVLAVDGGMNALWVLGVTPDGLLGDFDSCKDRALNFFRKQGVKELRFSVKKDMTDTELAICHMMDLGIDEALILGAGGSRLDHTLANVMLLYKYEKRIALTILDTHNRIRIGQKDMIISKDGYTYLSLLPISRQVKGLSLTGVDYPLKDRTLDRESSYAISNEITGDTCHLTFRRGKLLVVQSGD